MWIFHISKSRVSTKNDVSLQSTENLLDWRQLQIDYCQVVKISSLYSAYLSIESWNGMSRSSQRPRRAACRMTIRSNFLKMPSWNFICNQTSNQGTQPCGRSSCKSWERYLISFFHFPFNCYNRLTSLQQGETRNWEKKVGQDIALTALELELYTNFYKWDFNIASIEGHPTSHI